MKIFFNGLTHSLWYLYTVVFTLLRKKENDNTELCYTAKYEVENKIVRVSKVQQVGLN